MINLINEGDTSLPQWNDMIDMNSDSDESETGWVHWYCGLREHYFFIVIPHDYTRDAFNLYGLRQYFPKNYDSLIDLILSSNIPDEDDLADPIMQDMHREAGELYGLIHARYITTPRGLQVMKHKYEKGCFGKCPRVLCNGYKVLPIGITNELRSRRVRVYCPNCQEAYDPRNVNLIDIDGAFFGTSFPHIFLQVYPEYISTHCPEPYYPKVFGFRIVDRLSIIEQKGINGEYGKRAQEELFKARPSSLQHVEQQQPNAGAGKTTNSATEEGGGSLVNSSSNQDNLNSRNSEYNSTASSKTMNSSSTSNANGSSAFRHGDVTMNQATNNDSNSARRSSGYTKK